MFYIIALVIFGIAALFSFLSYTSSLHSSNSTQASTVSPPTTTVGSNSTTSGITTTTGNTSFSGSTQIIGNWTITYYENPLYKVVLNQSWGDNGTVHQYDGGINHRYIVNESIGNVNITLNDTITGPPTLYKGILFVTTAGPFKYQNSAEYIFTHGSVAAIDPYKNVVLWRTHLPNQIIGQPVTVGNLIIVGMGNNEEIPPQNFSKYNNANDGLFALNITNGHVVWSIRDGTPFMPTPAYYDGYIIAPNMNTALIVNATTGNVVHVVDTGLPDTMSSPLVVNGIAYFGAGTDNAYTSAPINGSFTFYAVNMLTGNFVWTKSFINAGAGLNDVVATYYKGIIVTGYLWHSEYTNPVIVGLNATTGKQIWMVNETPENKIIKIIEPPANITGHSFFLTEPTMSAVTLWHGNVYADSNFEGNLYCINATTGKPLWAFNTGQTESNPNIKDGYLYIVNDPGVLYVLNATTGALIKAEYIGMGHLSNEEVITKNSVLFTNLNGTVETIPINDLIH